jgi:hypothetical protein
MPPKALATRRLCLVNVVDRTADRMVVTELGMGVKGLEGGVAVGRRLCLLSVCWRF